MTTQVSVYPNPFTTSITFEIIIEKNELSIVRMLDKNHKIIKMMSWQLNKGTNKMLFENLEKLPAGNYFLDIINMEGTNLFSTRLEKL
jgi:hypothetical protein